MNKAVLLSIKPQWCELIARGEKTVEVRKSQPKLEPPFTCYIYCTKGDLSYPVGNGMVCHNNGGMVVIGEFTCDSIECFTTDYRMNKEQTHRISEQSCVGMVELMEYEANSPCLYAWHISNLKIYYKPKRLKEFYYLRTAVERPVGITNELFPIERPPQSWCYCKEV